MSEAQKDRSMVAASVMAHEAEKQRIADDAERAEQKELLPHRATTLEQVLGKVVPFAEAAAALAAGFAQQLNLTLQELSLTKREQALADTLRAEQYANETWLKRV